MQNIESATRLRGLYSVAWSQICSSRSIFLAQNCSSITITIISGPNRGLNHSTSTSSSQLLATKLCSIFEHYCSFLIGGLRWVPKERWESEIQKLLDIFLQSKSGNFNHQTNSVVFLGLVPFQGHGYSHGQTAHTLRIKIKYKRTTNNPSKCRRVFPTTRTFPTRPLVSSRIPELQPFRRYVILKICLNMHDPGTLSLSNRFGRSNSIQPVLTASKSMTPSEL